MERPVSEVPHYQRERIVSEVGSSISEVSSTPSEASSTVTK